MPKPESQVVRLSDAVFALGVYRSDLGGLVQDVLDLLAEADHYQVIPGCGWGYGAMPSLDTDFDSPFIVCDLVTRLLGYGIRRFDRPYPDVFAFGLRSHVGGSYPVHVIYLPMEGTSLQRLQGNALAQDSKRVWRGRGGMARHNARVGPDEPSSVSGRQGRKTDSKRFKRL